MIKRVKLALLVAVSIATIASFGFQASTSTLGAEMQTSSITWWWQ
ncbi:hypothetical protein V7094_29295 [Priestia megaterium]